MRPDTHFPVSFSRSHTLTCNRTLPRGKLQQRVESSHFSQSQLRTKSSDVSRSLNSDFYTEFNLLINKEDIFVLFSPSQHNLCYTSHENLFIVATNCYFLKNCKSSFEQSDIVMNITMQIKFYQAMLFTIPYTS